MQPSVLQIMSAYTAFVRTFEEKKKLGRTTRRFEDNIRMDILERRWNGADWITLVKHRGQWQAAVNMEMIFFGSIKHGKFLSSRENITFSGRNPRLEPLYVGILHP
jgi:hypothetical protein